MDVDVDMDEVEIFKSQHLYNNPHMGVYFAKKTGCGGVYRP